MTGQLSDWGPILFGGRPPGPPLAPALILINFKDLCHGVAYTNMDVTTTIMQLYHLFVLYEETDVHE